MKLNNVLRAKGNNIKKELNKLDISKRDKDISYGLLSKKNQSNDNTDNLVYIDLRKTNDFVYEDYYGQDVSIALYAILRAVNSDNWMWNESSRYALNLPGVYIELYGNIVNFSSISGSGFVVIPNKIAFTKTLNNRIIWGESDLPEIIIEPTNIFDFLIDFIEASYYGSTSENELEEKQRYINAIEYIRNNAHITREEFLKNETTLPYE